MWISQKRLPHNFQAYDSGFTKPTLKLATFVAQDHNSSISTGHRSIGRFSSQMPVFPLEAQTRRASSRKGCWGHGCRPSVTLGLRPCRGGLVHVAEGTSDVAARDQLLACDLHVASAHATTVAAETALVNWYLLTTASQPVCVGTADMGILGSARQRSGSGPWRRQVGPQRCCGASADGRLQGRHQGRVRDPRRPTTNAKMQIRRSVSA